MLDSIDCRESFFLELWRRQVDHAVQGNWWHDVYEQTLDFSKADGP